MVGTEMSKMTSSDGKINLSEWMDVAEDMQGRDDFLCFHLRPRECYKNHER
jgi:hypothetical protein